MCVPLLRIRAPLLTIRSQVTVLVSMRVVVLLILTGALGGMVAHKAAIDTAWHRTRKQADRTAAAVRAGDLTDPIVPGDPGIDQIQVVSLDHRVIASSVAAHGRPPMASVRLSPQAPHEDLQACAGPRRTCMTISAVLVGPTPGSAVVLAGTPASNAIFGGLSAVLFSIQAAVLVLLAVWASWRIVGRMLRPVNAIRAELAAINVNDLSGRVPEPSGNSGIAHLARTINNTLQRLENAREQLQRSLDQQRQFASDASHELRTPVAGLRTRLEEAQLYPDDTDLRDLLDRTLDDVDRLQAIITDLLLLAKIDGRAPMAFEEIDLAELVRTDVVRRAGDPHPVRIELEPGLRVEAVRTQISRVLANLLDNAQRHATHTVRIHLRRNGGSAELATTDDGEGIAESDRERIFQRFTRLDVARSRDQGGTGLGLAIARAIAQSHNGTLHAEDPPDGGAHFVLRLPLSPRHASAEHGNERSLSHTAPVSLEPGFG